MHFSQLKRKLFILKEVCAFAILKSTADHPVTGPKSSQTIQGFDRNPSDINDRFRFPRSTLFQLLTNQFTIGIGIIN